MVVAQGGRGDAAGEVQEAPTRGVIQDVALAVTPVALVVPAQNRGQARLGDGRVVAGRREGIDLRRGEAARPGADQGPGGGGRDDWFLSGGIHDVSSSESGRRSVSTGGTYRV